MVTAYHFLDLADALNRVNGDSGYEFGHQPNQGGLNRQWALGAVTDGLAVHITQHQPFSRRALQLQSHGQWITRLQWQGVPVFWSFIESDIYGAYLLRTYDAALQAYQPIGYLSSADCEHIAHMSQPLQARAWCKLLLQRLLQQQDHFLSFGEWHLAYSAAKPLATLSDENQNFVQNILAGEHYVSADWHNRLTALKTVNLLDGRLRFWRKQAQQNKLPPVLAWFVEPLHSYVILDGHLRLQAALDEGMLPPVILLSYAQYARYPVADSKVQQSLLKAINDADNPDKLNTVKRGRRYKEGAMDGLNLSLMRAFDDRPYCFYGTIASASLNKSQWLQQVKAFAQQHKCWDVLQENLQNDSMLGAMEAYQQQQASQPA